MQFSEQWLRQHVNPDLDSDALSDILTMAGLEVEGLEPVAPDFSDVVVARIVSAEKHPDADRLQVCAVDVGADEPLQIVCGAPNARVGLMAPCALVGAKLPGFDIKQAKVRGMASFGMLCSAKELGLAEDSAGLLELPADAPIGQDIREYLALNDKLFTLKLTPNRSDCLSIIGVARDVAALTASPLQSPASAEVSVQAVTQLDVRIDASAACPLYTGRILSGVDAKAQTPDWMKRRLERGGIRSISAIVDITNYVLLEMGQPLHAFDAAKLEGGIHVRMAHSGEKLQLLNQQEAVLASDMLVIADNSGAVALAGIMGGNASAVSDATTQIFLESAFFSPTAIAGKARRLGLSTDSSYRFERGVDFGATRQALERASALILEICGGEAGPVTEVQGQLPGRKPVRLRLTRLVAVLGIPLTESQVVQLLDRLGFGYHHADGNFHVAPPSYRFDIEIEEDLIEEIARLHGYDKIPATPPTAELLMLPSPGNRLSSAWLRDAMAASGYQEIVGYSFVDQAWERDLLDNQQPVTLKNPIASNMSVMRSSLWGGLIDTLVYNLNRKQERIRLFEVGATYAAGSRGFDETVHISGLAYGDVAPEQWGVTAREVDFFDVKAEVDLLMNARAEYRAAVHPALHPGQSAQVLLDGRAIGWLGKLHPKWQQSYGLPRGVVLFELDVEPLLMRTLPQYTEVPKFPPVRRDLAVLVDEKVAADALLNSMRQAGIPRVEAIKLFDIYRGNGVPQGKKSLAFLVLMQDTQKTLTDREADEVVTKLLDIIA
ncbi:MAG TPA: phenylalanine--tRNA ligase subunit beta, partial [Methylophilaceae bacterium]|nr:phenylalanine--tRNA ligase subunit beta [Methylophilaceae bacterium]